MRPGEQWSTYSKSSAASASSAHCWQARATQCWQACGCRCTDGKERLAGACRAHTADTSQTDPCNHHIQCHNTCMCLRACKQHANTARVTEPEASCSRRCSAYTACHLTKAMAWPPTTPCGGCPGCRATPARRRRQHRPPARHCGLLVVGSMRLKTRNPQPVILEGLPKTTHHAAQDCHSTDSAATHQSRYPLGPHALAHAGKPHQARQHPSLQQSPTTTQQPLSGWQLVRSSRPGKRHGRRLRHQPLGKGCLCCCAALYLLCKHTPVAHGAHTK